MENVVQKTLDRIAEELKKCSVFEAIEEIDRESGKCKIVLSGDDLKASSKEFTLFLEKNSSELGIVNLKGSREGVKFQIPLDSFEGVLLDVDAKYKSSGDSEQFKSKYINLPADRKALLEALVRTAVDRNSLDVLCKKVGIGKIPELQESQEYEFDLLDDQLVLKVVGDDEEYIVWETSTWKAVEKLLFDFNLESDFDTLLSQVASSSSSKVKNKIRSIMTGSLTGDDFEIKLRKTNDLLGEIESVEETKSVLIYARSFRPPHILDFKVVDDTKADRVIVLIPNTNEEGLPVSAEQSKTVWTVYRKYLSKPCDIRVVDSVEQDIRNLVENPEHSAIKFTVISSDVDGIVPRANVKVKHLTSVVKKMSERLIAPTLKKSIEIFRKGFWIPEELTKEDALKVMQTVVSVIERKSLQEQMKQVISKTLADSAQILEGSSGTPLSPAVKISSERRSELASLYKQLNSQLGSRFNVEFNNVNIIITPAYEGELSKMSYDPTKTYLSEVDAQEETQEEVNYVPYIVSYIKFLETEGVKIQPLPEVILNKEDQTCGLLDRKTGSYNHIDKVITLYSKDRNPKDVLRSFAHEMQHHVQCLEGKLTEVQSDKVSQDLNLEQLEAEAYRDGNIMFRKWTEKQRN